MATISEALQTAFRHHQAGRLELAGEIYRRILDAEPACADAWHLLGMIAYQAGQFAIAVDHIRRAIAISPANTDYHANLGASFKEWGKLEEAIACYRRALELKPDFAEAHNNLGNAFRGQGKPAEAVACYRRALELKPHFVEAHNNLGNAFKDQGKPAEAIACYRRALGLNPRFAEAHNNLANALKDQGNAAQAVDSFRRALGIKPGYALAHSGLLLALEYAGGSSATELAGAYAEYDRRHAAPLRSAWRPHANLRDPQRGLRLGFVAADFCRHPIGYSFLRVLETLPKEDCQIVCYSVGSYARDDFTARFQAAAGTWRDVQALSDTALAEQVHSDRIDILFDLCGHFAGCRLLTFARKPAPIQVAWTGPTGVSAMDYLLCDRHLVPPGAEGYYREQALRLPDAYTCFEPPPDAPRVGPLPARSRGCITFGSLNNLAKVNPEVIRAWSSILRRLPASRLVLRHWASGADRHVVRRLAESFAGYGVDRERIEVAGRASHADRLNLYQQIDLALDPFPFTGATTAYEALWMGVPTVTCPGEAYYSRMCLTHLMNAGLDDLVARDPDDYVERTVALAEDLPRLAELRAGLRERVAGSPLYDAQRFVANLMPLLRHAWQEWCHGPGST